MLNFKVIVLAAVLVLVCVPNVLEATPSNEFLEALSTPMTAFDFYFFRLPLVFDQLFSTPLIKTMLGMKSDDATFKLDDVNYIIDQNAIYFTISIGNSYYEARYGDATATDSELDKGFQKEAEVLIRAVEMCIGSTWVRKGWSTSDFNENAFHAEVKNRAYYRFSIMRGDGNFRVVKRDASGKYRFFDNTVVAETNSAGNPVGTFQE